MWKRLVLVELHAGFQISNKEVVVKPKFAVHDVETRFPFLYASTRLDTKTSIIASNRSFKAVRRFVVLLLSSFWDFPFLPRVFPLPLATLLVIVTSSSTLHWAIEIKKKSVWNGLLFPGNLDPSSLTPGGPIVLLVCGFRRRDNLLTWRELFANLYELKSRIWFWEECNHFERICRVYRFDRFSSNFVKTS